MKLRINAEVLEANGTPRRCLSFDVVTELVTTYEERRLAIELVRKVVELIADTALGEEADFDPNGVIWNGNAANVHLELRERKSALQRECPMYRDMNKPVLPDKYPNMVVSYE